MCEETPLTEGENDGFTAEGEERKKRGKREEEEKRGEMKREGKREGGWWGLQSIFFFFAGGIFCGRFQIWDVRFFPCWVYLPGPSLCDRFDPSNVDGGGWWLPTTRW